MGRPLPLAADAALTAVTAELNKEVVKAIEGQDTQGGLDPLPGGGVRPGPGVRALRRDDGGRGTRPGRSARSGRALLPRSGVPGRAVGTALSGHGPRRRVGAGPSRVRCLPRTHTAAERGRRARPAGERSTCTDRGGVAVPRRVLSLLPPVGSPHPPTDHGCLRDAIGAVGRRKRVASDHVRKRGSRLRGAAATERSTRERGRPGLRPVGRAGRRRDGSGRAGT